MQSLKGLAIPIALLSLASCAISSNSSNQSFSKSLHSDHANSFFLKLPKGGDLHNHLQGATYAENLMSYGVSNGFYVNMKNGYVSESKESSNFIPLKQVYESCELKPKLVELWSSQNFTGDSAHDHFFEAFAKFRPLTSAFEEDMIVEVLNRALLQNVSYLELMYNTPAKTQKSSIESNNLKGDPQKQFSEWYSVLKNEGIVEHTENMKSSLNQLEDRLTKRMSFDPFVVADRSPIALRLIYAVYRNKDDGYVFSRLAMGFDLASKDNRVVAVNLVAPEDNEIAMSKYARHMDMVAYLKTIYPNVAISLHAGELTAQFDPKKSGIAHIREAIYSAGAQRIGHGTDVLRDPNPQELAAEMAKRGTLVEINLTSNAFILEVKAKEHPLKFYLQNNVPVALSTDDEGILRTNITNEFVRAFHEQNLSYSEIKKMIRNSLHFSFLEGRPLWSTAAFTNMNGMCEDPSKLKKQALECEHFLNANPKAKLQWRLETELLAFERTFLVF